MQQQVPRQGGLHSDMEDSDTDRSNNIQAPMHSSPAAAADSLFSKTRAKRKHDDVEDATYSLPARLGLTPRPVKIQKIASDERIVCSAPVQQVLGSDWWPYVQVKTFAELMANTTLASKIWVPPKDSRKHPPAVQPGPTPCPTEPSVCTFKDLRANITGTRVWEIDKPSDKLPANAEPGLIPCPAVQQVGDISQCSPGLSGVTNADEKDQMLEHITATKISTETRPATDQVVKEPAAVIKGASLIDHFTSDQLRAHISSLKPGDDARADRDPCQLCGVNLLRFTPAPIYCSTCEARIKHDVPYYSAPDVSAPRHFCKKCITASKRGSIRFNGVDYVKSGLISIKNSGENAAEEPWVECDKCKKWQHQVCGLYNAKQDLNGDAAYTCPICCLNAGGQDPAGAFSATANVKRAKDLPTTKLSAYVESRLLRRLKHEKHEVSNIVVREVLSVDRKVKMQDGLYALARDSSHAPALAPELPYRSRAILVFQNIDGADVCIFIMFVQEHGSECTSKPNQRSVYISYLDSVKYFRPDVKSASGEAIRTFVYHQIMISYLDYCKKRGFATCYIWSCPPEKGEDFVFNCHPIDQKTPKPEKLQQWYQAMLAKAKKENVVVECTNIHDKFFAPNENSNARITAARLPYFDGAYWNLLAENLIKNIENDAGGPLSVKTLRKVLSTRALKDMKCSAAPSASTIKDILLMHKLGSIILPKKDNYIVASLQHTCAACDELILSSARWSAANNQRHLCPKCHRSDRKRAESKQQSSVAYTKLANNVPAKIEEDGAIIEQAFCENRVAFLKFCQEQNYQFDTLRRAKHSSMMLLHELFSGR